VKLAVLDRLSTVLSTPDSVSIKTSFVQNGGLQLVQEIGEEPGSPYHEKVANILALFPLELVNRYSPAYNKALLERLTLGESAHLGQQQQQQQQQHQQQAVVQQRQEQQAVVVSPPAQPPAPVAEEPIPEIKPFSAPTVTEKEEEIEINQPPLPAPAAKVLPAAAADKKNLKKNKLPAATSDTKPHVFKGEKTVINVTASSVSSRITAPAPQPPVPTATSPSPPPLSWSATPHKPLPRTPRDAPNGSTHSPRPSEY
jgi:hypothetical protein